MVTTSKPRIVERELSNADYHADDKSLSSSALKTLAASCPQVFWAKHLNPDRESPPPTKAMDLGTAFHTAVLEPELYDETICVLTASQNHQGRQSCCC